MTYRVLPCREYREPGQYNMTVERPRGLDQVEFWGVYFRDTDGLDQWVADFLNRDDAILFCRMKNQEQ